MMGEGVKVRDGVKTTEPKGTDGCVKTHCLHTFPYLVLTGNRDFRPGDRQDRRQPGLD